MGGQGARVSAGAVLMAALLLCGATAEVSAQEPASPPPAESSEPGLSVAPAVTPAPPDWTVNGTADAPDAQPGDGLCATAVGDCTLRAAVQEATASGGPRVIELPAGVFGLRAGDPHEDASVDGDLDIAGSLEVRGAGADATSVSGGRQSRLFQVLSGGSLTLRALALVDGSSSDGRAGAVDNAGNLVIEDARLEGNTATIAGAIRSSGTLAVRRTLFTDDRAEGGDGGAVQVLRGKATFEDSAFERDRSKGNGGALLVSDGTVSVSGTRFSLNEAYAGAVARGPGWRDHGGVQHVRPGSGLPRRRDRGSPGRRPHRPHGAPRHVRPQRRHRAWSRRRRHRGGRWARPGG